MITVITKEKCPQCGGELCEVRYPGGYLNRDQWESVRAGDFYCRTCPPDPKVNKTYKYFWDHEVRITEPHHNID